MKLRERYDDFAEKSDPPEAAEHRRIAEEIKKEKIRLLVDENKRMRCGTHMTVVRDKPAKQRRPPELIAGILRVCRACADEGGHLHIDTLTAGLGKDPNNPRDRNLVTTMILYMSKCGIVFPYFVQHRKPGRPKMDFVERSDAPRRPSPVAEARLERY